MSFSNSHKQSLTDIGNLLLSKCDDRPFVLENEYNKTEALWQRLLIYRTRPILFSL